MKHIAYGNITQRNEEKEVIIDSLKKMNCPVFIESDIDNRHSNHIFLFEHLCQLPRYDIFSEVLLYARHQNCIIG